MPIEAAGTGLAIRKREKRATDTNDSEGRRMTRAPWYLRQDVWMVVATLVIPFFWILPLTRAARARVSIHRDRRF
jgi:hypothetical protein